MDGSDVLFHVEPDVLYPLRAGAIQFPLHFSRKTRAADRAGPVNGGRSIALLRARGLCGTGRRVLDALLRRTGEEVGVPAILEPGFDGNVGLRGHESRF